MSVSSHVFYSENSTPRYEARCSCSLSLMLSALFVLLHAYSLNVVPIWIKSEACVVWLHTHTCSYAWRTMIGTTCSPTIVSRELRKVSKFHLQRGLVEFIYSGIIYIRVSFTLHSYNPISNIPGASMAMWVGTDFVSNGNGLSHR